MADLPVTSLPWMNYAGCGMSYLKRIVKQLYNIYWDFTIKPSVRIMTRAMRAFLKESGDNDFMI